jgi:NAD(P) transhydrogenase subunit alpha
MRVTVARETAAGESRVALVPETVKRLAGHGWEIAVQKGAGEGAFFSDEAYASAGARIIDDATELARTADVFLGVRTPSDNAIANLRGDAVLIALLDPLRSPQLLQRLAERGITSIAMELIPRITRAQSMDVLSSQATAAGYRAVLIAAAAAGRFFPMLMTAAGTIAPSKVLVLGAGVAGLQAIASARRLGAVVQGFDIRPAVKEQVESLGASWVGVTVADAETAGGYAKEISGDEQKRQHAHLSALVREADVVISTAQIPGKPAPLLVTADMVNAMRPGSVIIDLAAESGGNCELTIAGEDRTVKGVRILGPMNLAAGVPTHASQMYSRNLATLLDYMKTSTGVRVDLADEILGVCTVTHAGRVRVIDGRIPAREAAAGVPA